MSSKFADILELALIELEYAVADFMEQKPIESAGSHRNELETLLSKQYADERRKLIGERASLELQPGDNFGGAPRGACSSAAEAMRTA